jgi:hypothetical protein
LCSSDAFLLLFIRVLWNLKERLGIGAVLKSLAVILPSVVVLIILLLIPQSAEALLIHSRIWGFSFGLIFMPAAFVTFGYYYIYLTYKHKAKSRPKKTVTKQSDVTDLRSPSNASQVNSMSGDSVGELRLQLEAVMRDANGRKLLLNFMQLEFSIENFMFVEACSTYEAAFNPPNDGAGVDEIGQSIYENFIQESSPFTVNLPNGIRRGLLTKAKLVQKKKGKSLARSMSARFSINGSDPEEKEPPAAQAKIFTKDLFFDAKEEIMTLITKDTFARFKLTEDYALWAQPPSQRGSLLMRARQTIETLIDKV